MEKDIRAMDGDFNGMTAKTLHGEDYVVSGWYMDANGCLKTHDEGFKESFIDETTYEENSENDKKG